MTSPRRRDNTAKFAKALWSSEALDLAPAEFQKEFNRLYSAAEGIATLWQLGGAANDYLRRHPNSVKVPPELALVLLKSRLVDARIIGLKLLNRCSSDVCLIATWICCALRSRKRMEVYGGLFELSLLWPKVPTKVVIPADVLLELLLELLSSDDPYVCAEAARFVDSLESIG